MNGEIKKEKTILIVEDDSHIQTLMQKMLAPEGYTLYTASDLGSVKNILELSSIDLVLLDLMLPDGNGLDIIDSIRTTSPDSMIIVITGSPSLDTSMKAIEKKVFGYISKPFSVKNVREIVSKALEHQHSDRNVRRKAVQYEELKRSMKP